MVMEMEKAVAVGSSGNLYRLIGNIHPQKPRVSEVIKGPMAH